MDTKPLEQITEARIAKKKNLLFFQGNSQFLLSVKVEKPLLKENWFQSTFPA